MPNPVTVRYPLQPLADAMGVPLDTGGLARRLNLSGRTWKEYRDQGVSEVVADRLAVKAGLHPYTVWPEMVDAHVEEAHRQCADEKCGQPFIPRAGNHKFCSRACGARVRQRARARRLRADPATRAAKNAENAVYRAETRQARRAYSRRYYQANRERLLAEQRRRDHERRERKG